MAPPAFTYNPLQGVIERVLDKYIGEVAMLDSGDVVRVDQVGYPFFSKFRHGTRMCKLVFSHTCACGPYGLLFTRMLVCSYVCVCNTYVV